VSKVVSGQASQARIHPVTIERVRAVVRQMGYVPNQTARSLRAQRTGQIGVVMGGPYHPDMPVTLWLDGTLLTGLSLAAREHHLPAMVLYPEADDEAVFNPARYLDGRIDGLLVRCVMRSEDRLLHLVDPARLPIVAVWRQSVPDNVGYADIDHYGGACLAVQHLLGLGHRRIAYLGPDLDDDNLHFALRYRGYCATLQAVGIEPRTEWHARENTGILALLRGAPPITAVFASQDLRAADLATALMAVGLRIPEDISLVGFDDFPDANLSAGGLTTIRQPISEMGTQAIRNLMALIKGAPASACRTLVPAPLVVRHSTAPPPGEREMS
jgi:LacI family transcriptional regulator